MIKGTLSIIAPISEKEFFAKYYEERCLHVSRDNSSYFEELISLEDLDGILNSDNLYYPDINLKKKGGQVALQPWINETSNNSTLSINKSELYKQIAQGQTLIINNIQNHLPKFNEFMVSNGNKLGVRHSANVYITPPNQQGFNWHYDDHDVCILQIKGDKTWNIIEEETFLPDSNYKSRSPIIEEPPVFDTGTPSLKIE